MHVSVSKGTATLIDLILGGFSLCGALYPLAPSGPCHPSPFPAVSFQALKVLFPGGVRGEVCSQASPMAWSLSGNP